MSSNKYDNFEKIHVCYGIHDPTGHYSIMTGTSISSIFTNTQNHVTIHLLHDNTLTQDNYNKFKILAAMRKQEIIFYNLEELAIEKMNECQIGLENITNSRLTIGAMYRLFAPYVLPDYIKKVIYLDGDTIVDLDISELWNEAIGNAPLAAVPSFIATQGRMMDEYLCDIGKVRKEKHFCSGIMVMNLDYIRKTIDIIHEGLLILNEYKKCFLMDQDILNYLYSELYYELPLKYNVFTEADRHNNKENKIHFPSIRHFAGGDATVFPPDDLNNFMWMQYMSLSPWFEGKYISKLFIKTSSIIREDKNLLLKTLSRWEKKKKIFLYDLQYGEYMIENVFQDFDNKKCIQIPKTYEPNKDREFEQCIENHDEEKYFIVCSTKSIYLDIKKILLSLNYIEGSDFIYGLILVSDERIEKYSINVPYFS